MIEATIDAERGEARQSENHRMAIQSESVRFGEVEREIRLAGTPRAPLHLLKADERLEKWRCPSGRK
jgi:hypothetical protein